MEIRRLTEALRAHLEMEETYIRERHEAVRAIKERTAKKRKPMVKLVFDKAKKKHFGSKPKL